MTTLDTIRLLNVLLFFLVRISYDSRMRELKC